MFTDLTPTRLEQTLKMIGTPASDDTLRQWMENQNLRLRKIIKVKAGGESPDRDAQFKNIARLIEQYQQAGHPYFSVDTKAKEFREQLFRKGRGRCSQPFKALDHDFPSWADGVIIPHGLFDRSKSWAHQHRTYTQSKIDSYCSSNPKSYSAC